MLLSNGTLIALQVTLTESMERDQTVSVTPSARKTHQEPVEVDGEMKSISLSRRLLSQLPINQSSENLDLVASRILAEEIFQPCSEDK
jgi:hypothetical protein